ncbi:PREDICTED: heat shock protein 90-2-like [Prunus mume]|uniref:Heat shock protein 90-2-like n=1 Tax=Prunus mume TaxID=102107 RepID=A0ABM1LRI3_PRUMU|nr:PREDICTED: heat shock protein 90-2-like [Prunus mume]
MTTTTTTILPKPDVAYRRSGDLCKALDKIRFESMTDKRKLNDQLELSIPDKNNNTLTIINSGIGMTKVEGLCDCFW